MQSTKSNQLCAITVKRSCQNHFKFYLMKFLSANMWSIGRKIVQGLTSISRQATKNNCSGFWRNLLTATTHSRCSPFDTFTSAECTMIRARIMECKGQLSWRSHKCGDQHKETKSGKQTQTHSHTDHDFVLSCEVGRLTQQLTLWNSDRAGGLSYQHSVVKPHPSWCRGNQVSALWAWKDGRQGVKLGGKLRHKSPMKINNFTNPQRAMSPKYSEN